MALTFWIVLLALGAAGALLGLLGRRSRPDGHAGWCRRCRHPLMDGAATCPECGAGLDGRRAVRRSRLRPRWAVASIGILAALLGAIGGTTTIVARAAGFDWESIKPVALLAWEANAGAPQAGRRAREEIYDRYATGDLSPGQLATCVSGAIDRLASREGWRDDADALLVEDAWREDLVPDDAMRDVCRATSSASIATADQCRHGQPLQVQVRVPFVGAGNRYDPSAMLMMRFSQTRTVDGAVLSRGTAGRFGQSFSIFNGGVSTTAALRVDLPIGRHDLEVDVEFTVTRNDVDRFTWTETFVTSTTVVPEEASIVAAVPDESARPVIREAAILDFEHLSVAVGDSTTHRMPMHCGFVALRGTRVAVAFDVYLRTGDSEHHFGTIVQSILDPSVSNAISDFTPLAERLPEGTTSVDVILRSNPRLAERTVPVITGVWEGEIVFRDVPVALDPLDADD